MLDPIFVKNLRSFLGKGNQPLYINGYILFTNSYEICLYKHKNLGFNEATSGKLLNLMDDSNYVEVAYVPKKIPKYIGNIFFEKDLSGLGIDFKLEKPVRTSGDYLFKCMRVLPNQDTLKVGLINTGLFFKAENIIVGMVVI